MRQQVDTPDAIVGRIAARQHGVVSYEQLLWAGLTPSGVARRVPAGRLHRLYRGVYAVGHTALGNEGRWMAAVLASGDGAVLAHRSAAELWGMLQPKPSPIHVSVPTTAGRLRRPGIRIHRCPSLPNEAMTRHKSIPVTTPARTLADLCRSASVDELRRAIREAEFRRLPIGDQLGPDERTRSKLERRFLALCRRHRLPKPEVNVMVGPHEVDFLWRRARLIVEVDGYRSHGTRSAFEEDRARDVELSLLGYEVVRFTHRQVIDQPNRVVRALLRLLA